MSSLEVVEAFGRAWAVLCAGDRVAQRWRYDWDGGHIRGVDVFKLRDGKITENLSYVKG
jgi:hypothetical protein